MTDAEIISDVHLGADVCEAKALLEYLRGIEERTRRLIINGDLVDSLDLRRLTKSHWHVLSKLRKLSKRMEVIWVEGNHDCQCEILSHMIGTRCRPDYILHTGLRTMYVCHGHQFDQFLDKHPILTWVGDWIYWLVQKLDKSYRLATGLKLSSKQFLRNEERVTAGMVKAALKHGCNWCAAGHTHMPRKAENFCMYWNSGSWTDKPCHYLRVDTGQVQLVQWVVGKGGILC